MVYLIDTENVGNVAWAGFLKKKEDVEQVVLFYTKNSAPMSLNLLQDVLSQYSGKTRMVPCYIGKNALDFQLVSTMGYLIARSPHSEYCILSKDTGYDAVVQFWKDHGIKVTREIPNYTVINTKKNPPESQNTDMAFKPIEATLKDSGYEKFAPKIYEILQKSLKQPKDKRKDNVCKNLLAMFGQKEGIKIYYSVRDFLTTYYNNCENANTMAA